MKEMSRYQDTPIGSYRPARLIGVGPVSRVYVSERADRSERPLALKLFEAVPLDQLEEKDQALDEVRLLACLEHPAILPILDDGIHENMLYLVEPYIEAGSLRQRLASAAGELLPLKETMALLRQVGEALQFAHAQQIVHANLKPENILLQNDGKVLLADFLLPSLVKSERAARILSTFAALYMAPEQFQGITTPLSDQYALACLAYELLTGQPPFEADDFMSLARKHATQEPVPPSQLQPKRAQHIDHVILKALVKRPAGRYPDIQTFLAELSAPPPLVAVASAPGSILGVALPPAILPDPLPSIAPMSAVIVAEPEIQLPQESFPAALAVFNQETMQQKPLEVLPTLIEPGVHEVATIVIPAALPDMRVGAGQQMGFVSTPARRAILPTRPPLTTRLSRRQVWLTVALVALAMLISISGIAFFIGASANHAQSQASGGGVTTTLSPTSSLGQTPAGTTTVSAMPAAASSPTATATHKPTPSPKPTSAKPTPRAKPTATATATPSPTATAASLSCKVVYQFSSRWSNGFVANLTITNTGGATIQGWKLVFNFPGQEQILNGWSGHFTQSGAQVTITNDNSNPTLAPGSSATPGFQAISPDRHDDPTPSSFTLNGVACQ